MTSLPYITSPGNIDKALNGIKNATVPERVSQDFVKTILKIPGGSGAQMTSFLKKLGLTNNDGSPNEVYKQFRNPTSSGSAITTAIKFAYAPLYVRNEFTHELSDSALLGLVVEETGLAHDSAPVKLTVSCIKHLKAFASFNGSVSAKTPPAIIPKTEENPRPENQQTQSTHTSKNLGLGLNLGYTINLNLPATSDSTVFDAIFRSLKEHLLSNEDG